MKVIEEMFKIMGIFALIAGLVGVFLALIDAFVKLVLWIGPLVEGGALVK